MDNLILESSKMKPNPLSPNYSFVFEFEQQFNPKNAATWMRQHWIDSFYWTFFYLSFIFFGRLIMNKKEKPFELRTPLLIWNIMLASFSIIGTLRTWPEMIHVLKNYGFHHSVCSDSYHKVVPVSSFWTWLFVLSKLPELVDTVFIVLRKQRLIFLHWYHHATVLIFSWYCYADEISAARWYMNMNFFVHACMYTYYALRAAGIKIARPLAMCITASQIIQMIIASFITGYAYYAKLNQLPCRVDFDRIYAGIAIYASYFILFAHFFINSYFINKKSTKNQTIKSEKIQ